MSSVRGWGMILHEWHSRRPVHPCWFSLVETTKLNPSNPWRGYTTIILVLQVCGGEKYLFPILVKKDASKNWNSFFISHEFVKFLLMTAAVLPQQGTMVEYTFGEFAEWQGWKTMRVLFPDKILVEPVCLFYLEADSWYRHELFGGYVDNKSTTRCGCQCYGLCGGWKEW